MKLIDAICSLALWGICIPVFSLHFIAIERSYQETILRLKELADIQESVNLFVLCHDKKKEYPDIKGYSVTSRITPDGEKRETLNFNWKGKKITYEFRQP